MSLGACAFVIYADSDNNDACSATELTTDHHILLLLHSRALYLTPVICTLSDFWLSVIWFIWLLVVCNTYRYRIIFRLIALAKLFFTVTYQYTTLWMDTRV